MQFSAFIPIASALAIARACTQCPHPGVFIGTLGLYTDPSTAYCSLEDNPSNSIYASIPIAFFDPPDESPCDGLINVTNPSTGKVIKAIVVGKCTDCTGDNILLTTDGLAALSPDGSPNHAPGTISWTFQ